MNPRRFYLVVPIDMLPDIGMNNGDNPPAPIGLNNNGAKVVGDYPFPANAVFKTTNYVFFSRESAESFAKEISVTNVGKCYGIVESVGFIEASNPQIVAKRVSEKGEVIPL